MRKFGGSLRVVVAEFPVTSAVMFTSLGLLLGSAFGIPLLDMRLADGAAELIGAAFGAIVAISGAELLRLRSEWRKQSEFSNALISMIQSEVYTWDRLAVYFEGLPSTDPDAASHMHSVMLRSQGLMNKLARFMQVAPDIDITLMQLLVDFEHAVAELPRYIEASNTLAFASLPSFKLQSVRDPLMRVDAHIRRKARI